MTVMCPECRAPVPDGGSCRDNFDALLLLEWQILGASAAEATGMLAHFYAVASYGLQHPASMNYSAQALLGLYQSATDALNGKATVNQLRSRARQAAEGSTRVTRRSGEPEPSWRRGTWPMTIADVLTCEPEMSAYAACVERWARSIIETLDLPAPVGRE
jgi:hypothetical protein